MSPSLATQDEIARLDGWNATSRRHRPEATVHGLFRERAAAHPERVALVWDGGRMTYGELDRRSDALAAQLVAAGVGTDARVGILVPRSAEAIVAVLATLKAGGAYVPVDPEYPEKRRAFLLGDAGVRVAVTARGVVVPADVATIQLDLAESPTGTSEPLERSSANGLAYVMYTSGSTGVPKGVLVEHRSIVRLVGDVDYVRLDESTSFLHAAPLGFDASTLELWGPLLHGGRVAILADAVPTGPRLAAHVAAHGVTSAWLTSALFNAIVDDDPAHLRGIRELLTGGEALSPAHVRRALDALPDTRLVNGYGPTECTTFATTHAITRDAGAIPIGKPIADTQLYVLDDAHRRVAIGEIGELYVGGRGVARGYLNRPELDAERFVASSFTPGERLYRTGDLVRFREDGVLDFVGRADQQVKIRGFRIELGEVETKLGALPSVKACAVIARDDGNGKRLVAYVVAEGEASVPRLREALESELPDFMVPSGFVFLAALPLTANGKLDRAALPAPTRTRPELAQPFAAPSSDLEVAVAAAFAEVLGLERVGANDGFFELGGDSLSALRLIARLRGLGSVTAPALYAAPTPAGLARALRGETSPAPVARRPRANGSEPIAVIGMAGRFPGAEDVEAFWSNLCAGVESIRFFRPEELDASIPSSVRTSPAYVAARGVLDGVDLFDAAFFGVSPLEAQTMDPQHRHFLEVSWHALEHAGYVPERVPGPVGVFGGMYNATYYQRHLWPRPDLVARLGELQVMLGNEKDYLTSRTAFKLGLSGPSVSVHTACSTSLVATVTAMESLRSGACDVALAGGVAITCPPASGHVHQEGSMASADGHTRTFDARATGTVFSDGVGVVVLRRLSDAIAAGDPIHAVLLDGAINNDGNMRGSFTAPSPEGQAAVVAAALEGAGVDARTISYVEAHGTATPLGDPIEIEGLTRAFRRTTQDTDFCAIGSAKSNIGHTVIAAGVAGLIKTSLALSRKVLPPTIGFVSPNPQIDFAKTPFRVQTELAPWPQGTGPRRAGVSSFGFGGTNAHVVVEEPPAPPPTTPSPRGSTLLLLSARTPQALEAAGARLARHLADEGPGGGARQHLDDVAHTLRVGRRAFAHRRWVVAPTHAEAVRLLGDPTATSTGTRVRAAETPEVVFLCPGQGSQYAAMGRGLYETEPAFREAYDACCAILGGDPKATFFSDDPATLVPTGVTQPAIFALEYALARLWQSWGVVPRALVGHSVGELVCAALADVMSLEDALGLVAERGARMQALPAGSMLSVRLPAAELEGRLPDGVVVAAENAPGLAVAAGPTPLVERLEADLVASGVVAKRLVTSHAFHSAMMDPVVEPMVARAARARLAPPRIPILSTVTGTWLRDEEATDPRYWGEHLRRPVRFAPAVARLLEDERRVLLEIGPRATLSALARQAVAGPRARPVAVPSLGDAPEKEGAAVLAAAGQLWSLGVELDPDRLVAHETRRRVPLPGYPFERQRHWVEAPAAHEGLVAPPVERPTDDAVAPAVAAAPPPSETRRDRLLGGVRAMVEEVSGLEVGEADAASAWLELGLDSLTLTQLALQVQKRFGVKVTFREIMERTPSMATLAQMLDGALPPDGDAEATSPAPAPAPKVVGNEEETAATRYDVKKAFGAIARIHTQADELTPHQRAHLDRLIARYTKRTARSKAYTTEHRGHMADPRVVNGFRPLTKELVYQIVIERSRGSHLWDIDGNEYVDVLSGFGMSLFGWQPDFLREAVHAQVDLGYEIGPQHVLAGETAKLFCELTGADRAAFCNTGSEAVMGAMRIARTVTGRSTIAIFTGAYHGIFDEVIVRGTRKLKTIPAAPGILPESAQNVLVLDYGTPETLAILKERAGELAAIVAEPVQSRRPDFQPVEFLRELRAITEASGSLLIFDEVVTGFRAHPAGIQGLFGIDADLASYGKVVGGGFPIGVIAGKRRFMDALDGGHWDYGDGSIPTVGVTYFAGTFVRHPLALAAANAALRHMKEAGPALQRDLTAKTAGMIAEINRRMAAMGAPFELRTFASLWRNFFTEDLPYGDLVYAMLRDRGIHILDNFPCFLTTSHTDADIRAIVDAYEGAAREMQEAGFFPRRTRTFTVPASPGSEEVVVREVASTDPQREVWLASELGPEASLAYDESVSIDLRGELDVGAFRHAVRDVVARHDALSATFTEEGTRLRVPMDRAAFARSVEVPFVDLSGAGDREARLRAITERHVRKHFDLGRGPLVEIELVRLAPDHHVLVLTGHHIVLDGWSFWVLVKDLSALYALATGARQTPLEPAPSFVDYAAERASRESSAEMRTNVAWWVERFADGGPTLALPTDRPRPKVRTQRAGRVDHTIPASLLARLKTLGAKHGASLFATLLGAFHGLLHRLTGQSDIVVGIPAAGQSAAGLGGLVGHCVSTLPLRLMVERNAPFTALLAASRTCLLDAYDHQDVTFGRVLQALPLTRDPSRLPLVSVVFNIDQALSSEAEAAPGVRLGLRSNARVAETFELFVNAVDEGQAGMRFECQYNQDLFDEATVARWMRAFEHLLAGAADDPSCALGRLPVLGEDDRAELARFTETAATFDANVRIEELVARTAASRPDAVAVRASGRAFTYAEVTARAAQIAAALTELGVRPGDRVGLLVPRDGDLLPSILGALASGACYVPLDPAFPVARLAYMAVDAELRAVVSTSALLERLDVKGVPALRLDALPAAPPRALERAADTLASDDAYLIYTSGSTGTPKGVQIPHAAVVNFHESLRREPGFAAGQKLVAVTTLSFDIAVLELLVTLATGMEIILATRDESTDGAALKRLIEEHAVDVMQATPTTWRLLVEAGWRGSPRFKALCGGEAMPPELAAELLARTGELWNMYGPTETTVWSAIHRVTEVGGAIPIGRPIANTSALVLDEDGQLVPTGVVGELHLGGAGLARGYFRRPELTAERFVASKVPGFGRLYRTGDLARFRRDGVLECLGRVDFQVKVRGYRIELGEIESALATHPAVSQAAVTTREVGPGDVRLLGYVIPKGDEAPSEADLRAHVGRTLPEYMIPSRVVRVVSFPLTGSGKVDRKALPAPEASPTDATSRIAPRNERETLVHDAFASALGVREVSIHDDFFALGGHSLLAAQTCARLGREVGRTVPMRIVFERPTIAGLAAWLDETAPPLETVPRREEKGPAPLSMMQERVFYLEQLQLGRTVFNVPSAHRLRGALDVDALQRAFAELVRRQPSLRTVLRTKDGETFQIVLDEVDVSIPFDDLSTEEDPAASLTRRLEEMAARPFDLATPPLFLVRLFRLAPDHHVFAFMAHHAIFDGWSFDLLYVEMSELYAAIRARRAHTLAPLAVDYADFAVWHRSFMQGPELARQLAHWKTKLAGAPRVLDVPTDEPRPAMQSGEGKTAWLRLDDERAASLRALAAREGATFFMTLLATWTILLGRLSGKREVVVGTPVRGRSLPELEPVMGFFVNALPLRLSFDPDRSFVEALRAVRAEVVLAFGSPDVPFEHLVRVLDVSRDESRFPIYQAFFSYQDARGRPGTWGDLEHENVPVFQPSAAQDLALWFLDGKTGVVGGLNYNTDVFTEATAASIRTRFLALVDAFASHPERPVRDSWALSSAELDELVRMNRRSAPFPDETLPTYLEHAMRSALDDVAICTSEGDETLTYRELLARSGLIADALRSRGVGTGDVVGLHLDRTPTMVAALLGVLEAGATYLPLDPAFPPDRLEFMLLDGGARVVIVDDEAPGLRLPPERVLRVDPRTSAPADGPPAPAALPVTNVDVRPAERPAYLIYTSGSTGKAKGVLVPHRAVVSFLHAMREEPGLARGQRLAAVTTLSFDIAVLELLLPLAVGAEIVLCSRAAATDGHALRAVLERHRVDVLQATPSTWRLLVEAGWRGGPRFKALCGGEAMPAELADALLSRTGELWNMYGPTETTVWSTCGRIEPGQGEVTIGRPIANTEVWVLDDRGDRVPVGVLGEIHIGGAGVALGYHERPDLTAERFVADRFSATSGARLYRTGDLGRLRADGRLQHLGRTDFQVKLRGHRIELGEIEAVLERHPDIEHAVVACTTPAGGEARLVAYVVARGPMPEVGAIREHLRRDVPAYMVPSQFVPMDRLPLTPNGKVDRRALPTPAEVETETRPVGEDAPQTDRERLVAEIWSELLGVKRITRSDNFLDLGGHSLLVMRAVALIEKRTGTRLSPRGHIFQRLEQIAAEIAPPESAPAVPVSRVEAKAPPSGAAGRVLQRVLSAFRRA